MNTCVNLSTSSYFSTACVEYIIHIYKCGYRQNLCANTWIPSFAVHVYNSHLERVHAYLLSYKTSRPFPLQKGKPTGFSKESNYAIHRLSEGQSRRDRFSFMIIKLYIINKLSRLHTNPTCSSNHTRISSPIAT